MNTYPEHNLVQKCLQLIEEKLQWGDATNWHNDVFLELSEKIRDETSVLLSPTTLKRVWGRVKYNSAPSISTLNTLAQFAGYNNWREFKNSLEDKEQVSWFAKAINPNIHIIVISAVVLALGFVSVFSFRNLSDDTLKRDYSNIKFSSQPITSGLPNSVVFNFNLDGIRSDSILIQQYWDVTKTVNVNDNQSQATAIYYYPGYFASKLRIDGQIIREHDLFIKSDGWLGTIDYKPVPKYITDKLITTNKIGFTNETLNEIKSSEKPLQTAFHYVDDFRNTSIDNIEIQQTVNSIFSDKWAVCQKLNIVILGTEGAVIIPFSKLGCVSDLNLLLNDIYLRGKEHDLSAFGVDLGEDTSINITIKDKNVTVLVNDTEIYNRKYNISVGRFVGLRYRFIGAGMLENLSIKDLRTQNIILEK